MLQRQYQALSAMPAAKITYSELGLVRLIEGETGVVLSSRALALREGDSAAEVLDRFRDVLLASGDETLKVQLNMEGVARTRVMRFDQYIRGIPVLNGGVSLDVEPATRMVRIMGAYFLPDRELPRAAKLTASEATALTVRTLEAREVAKVGTVTVSSLPTLAYHGISPDSTRGRLVWAVIANYASASSGDRSNGIYWIDAIDGEYVGEDTLTVAALDRTVYTANNGAPPPANFPTGLSVLFGEGGSSSDQLAMNVYANAGKANTAYASLFSWNADPLALIVHYNTGPPNAGTTRVGGVDYLHFSDGNAEKYPHGDVLDVVGHEFGHTINRKVAGITPGPDPLSDPQSAALDEAFSDVAAMNVDAYHRPGIADATWVIGEVFRSDPTKGVRSAANPKSMSTSAQDWFPARVLGPHAVSRYPNTTIMTHAYKLLITGGFHVRNGQPIGGNAIGNIPSLHVSALAQNLASAQDKAARIFQRALENPSMRPFPDFVILKSAASSLQRSCTGNSSETPSIGLFGLSESLLVAQRRRQPLS